MPLPTAESETRIVITGMGAVSPAGIGVAALWDAVENGRGLGRMFTPAGSTEAYPACPVPEDQFKHDGHPALRRQDRHVRMGAAAAAEAWRHAGLCGPDGREGSLLLSAPAVEPTRVALVWGTSRGPLSVWDESWQDAAKGRRPRPTLVPAGTLAAGAGALSVLLGARGPVECISSACASGSHAIAAAARLILTGEADVALAGASDAVLSRVTLAQFQAAGLVAAHAEPSRACRPFDRARNGTVFGEGAGAVVLESSAHAARRGVTPLARLAGWGLSADAAARIDPEPTGEGLARAMASALSMAGVAPADIGYANLHGTGTIANDETEARALRTVFGAAPPLCGSTKGVTGHCIGATPALEAIIGVMALRQGVAPPSANLEDPAFDLPLVTGSARPFTGRCVISTSAGFWGLNACLALAQP